MVKTLIVVKQKHINEGRKSIASACPIALAFKETLGRRVGVTRSQFRFLGELPDYEGYEEIYRALPKKAGIFVHRFDNGYTVRPFSFEVEL